MSFFILVAVGLPVALVTLATISYGLGNADVGRLLLSWGIVVGVLQMLVGGAVALLRK